MNRRCRIAGVDEGTVDATVVGNQGVRGMQITIPHQRLAYGEGIVLAVRVHLRYDGNLEAEAVSMTGELPVAPSKPKPVVRPAQLQHLDVEGGGVTLGDRVEGEPR